MLSWIFRRWPKSIKSLALATGFVVIATIGTAGAGLASTDPNAGLPMEPLEPVRPFSERCQRAMNVYFQEAEWFMDHPTGGIGDPDFGYHWSRLWDGWYISEMECGIDIDHSGHLGY